MVKSRQFATEKGPFLGIRHLQTFLYFSGVAVAYSMRVNLSVAIVAMTDKNSANPIDYTPTQKSLILSSFFVGYVITQIPGGHFARKFGGKKSLLMGVFISSILAILTPCSALLGDWRLPYAVRVLQGMSQGVIYPSTHTLLAKWAPITERAILGTFAYSGGQFGTVVMFIASGFIASSSLGWAGLFYTSGGVGLIWTLAWFFLGSSMPSEHRSITEAERIYIEKSIANNEEEKELEDSSIKRHHPNTPWIKFLKSPPFWALLIAHSSTSWAFWTMLTQIPTYMKNILGFDIKSNALLTALPYFVMLLLNIVFAALQALITKRKWLNLTGSRKFFNTLASWVPAAALACLGYLDANQTKLAIFLLVIAVGFGAAMHMGFMINHIDLSPNFAGIMMGFTNAIANIMSILAPLAVGVIVYEEHNVFQWRIVFLIAAGYSFLGNLLFIIFGSAEVQSFNEPDQINNEELKPMNKESNKI